MNLGLFRWQVPVPCHPRLLDETTQRLRTERCGEFRQRRQGCDSLLSMMEQGLMTQDQRMTSLEIAQVTGKSPSGLRKALT